MPRLDRKKITMKLSEKVKDLLVKEGFDPFYGARPLKRTIQKRVLDPLAMKLLSGEIKEGMKVLVEREKEGILFKTK